MFTSIQNKGTTKITCVEKAEQSGPVEAESKHSEAALQTLLQKLCEYQIQIPAEKEKKKKILSFKTHLTQH